VGRWTDTTKYPNLVSPAAGDLLPIADVSEDEGQRQRTITWAQLAALAAAGATVDTVDPDSDDDETAGYSVGSLWYNETSGTLFVCTDESSSGAVWEEISGGGAGALGDLTDVDTTGAGSGDVLTYDGAGWAPAAPTGGGGGEVPTEIGSAVDLYVNASTGDDTTGDGTSGTPYATIGRAIEDIPTIVTARYTINVADGTYREQVDLVRFIFPAFTASSATDARIVLTGNTTTPANCVISGADSGTPTTATRNFCVRASRCRVSVSGFSLEYAVVRGLDAGGSSAVALGAMRYANCTTAMLLGGYTAVTLTGNQTIADCGTGIYQTVYSRFNTDGGSRSVTMTGITLRGLYVVESALLLNAGDSLSIAAAASGTRIAGVEADGVAVIDIPVTVSVTGAFGYSFVSSAGSRIHIALASVTVSGATSGVYLAADGGSVWDTTSSSPAASSRHTAVFGAATNAILSSLVEGDSATRFTARVDGQLQWGPGDAARDIFLSRTAPTGGKALEIESDALTEIRLWTNAGGNTAKSSIQQTNNDGNLYLFANGRGDGSGFARDNTSQGLALVQISQSAGFLFRYAASGANPATMTTHFRVSNLGNIVTREAALATNATDGFLYIPSMAGNPSGTPTAYTAAAAIVLDSTNNRLYVRSGANWRYASLT
jgi:hypothetical protein